MAETKNFVTLANLGYFKTKQDAFNAETYVPLAQKGVANGVATLDANGLVPAAQLPSYVDDVLEFAALASCPATLMTYWNLRPWQASPQKVKLVRST